MLLTKLESGLHIVTWTDIGLLSSSDSSLFLSLGGKSDPDGEEKNNRGY